MLVLAILGVAYAHPWEYQYTHPSLRGKDASNPNEAVIVKETHEQHPEGQSFYYSYELSDGQGQSQKMTYEPTGPELGINHVTGDFQWTDEFNKVHKTQYIADEGGYRTLPE